MHYCFFKLDTMLFCDMDTGWVVGMSLGYPASRDDTNGQMLLLELYLLFYCATIGAASFSNDQTCIFGSEPGGS